MRTEQGVRVFRVQRSVTNPREITMTLDYDALCKCAEERPQTHPGEVLRLAFAHAHDAMLALIPTIESVPTQ